MSVSNFQDPSSAQGCARGGSESEGRGPTRALALPRVVTTGRKKTKERPVEFVREDPETGESVVAFDVGCRRHETRFIATCDDVPSTSGLIDAVAFSVIQPDEKSYVWVMEQMQQFLEIQGFQQRKGMFGFRYSARFGDGAGIVAWGGDSQRGHVFFSLMGKGCSMVQDWHGLAIWLEGNRAVIKRVDVAHDDFEGKVVSIALAVDQYKADGFNAGGRKPRHEVFGDWLEGDASVKGRTLGIGNRSSGKYARIYEKGKQLGEETSPWTRVEVEWRAQDRFIPCDVLVNPGHYLAGAYPCLAFLSEKQSSIKTQSKGGQIAYDSAVDHAKRHCGKIVNLMLAVNGGDYAGVVDGLIRPGYPARIDPFSYQVRQDPTRLDRQMAGAS